MVSRLKELAEEARVSIRSVRRDANKNADQSSKDKVMSEDQRDDTKDSLQELTKKYEGQVNSMSEKKTQEIMED